MINRIESVAKVSKVINMVQFGGVKSSIYLVKGFHVHSYIYHKKYDCNIFDVIYVTMIEIMPISRIEK